jgi:hypothetical protein
MLAAMGRGDREREQAAAAQQRAFGQCRAARAVALGGTGGQGVREREHRLGEDAEVLGEGIGRRWRALGSGRRGHGMAACGGEEEAESGGGPERGIE